MTEANDKPASGRDFQAELRAEEASRQAAGIPPAVERAVWARLEISRRGGPHRRPARRLMAALALSVVGAAAVVLLVVLRPAPRLGELEVARRSRDLVAQVNAEVVSIEAGSATLVDRASGLTVATNGKVALRREPRGVRLVRGHIEVDAAHRPAGAPPATIYVSDGAIEVMGTAFTVTQEETGGSVTLREGRIRFRAAAGGEVSLLPGESLAWPLASPSVPEAARPSTPARTQRSPRSSPAAQPRVDADPALLDRIEELRSRHEYEAAARTIREALSTQPAAMRERLSFELGSLLTHQIGDVRRACAQWLWHQRHFSAGRYRDEVARARRELGCASRTGAP